MNGTKLKLQSLVLALVAAQFAVLPELMRNASAASDNQDPSAARVQRSGDREARVGVSRGGSSGGSSSSSSSSGGSYGSSSGRVSGSLGGGSSYGGGGYGSSSSSGSRAATPSSSSSFSYGNGNGSGSSSGSRPSTPSSSYGGSSYGSSSGSSGSRPSTPSSSYGSSSGSSGSRPSTPSSSYGSSSGSATTARPAAPSSSSSGSSYGSYGTGTTARPAAPSSSSAGSTSVSRPATPSATYGNTYGSSPVSRPAAPNSAPAVASPARPAPTISAPSSAAAPVAPRPSNATGTLGGSGNVPYRNSYSTPATATYGNNPAPVTKAPVAPIAPAAPAVVHAAPAVVHAAPAPSAFSRPATVTKAPVSVTAGKLSDGTPVHMEKRIDSSGREQVQVRNAATGQYIKSPVAADGSKLTLNQRGQWRTQDGQFVKKPTPVPNGAPMSASEIRNQRATVGHNIPPVNNSRESSVYQTSKFVSRTTVINNTTIVNRSSYYDHTYRPGVGTGFVAGMLVGAALATPYYHPYYYNSIYVPTYLPVYSCGGVFGWCGGYYYPNPYLGAMDAAIQINLAVANANANAAANAAAGAAARAEWSAAEANARAAAAEARLQEMIAKNQIQAAQADEIRRAIRNLNKLDGFQAGDVVKVPEDMEVTVAARQSLKDSEGNEIGFDEGDKCHAVQHGSAEVTRIVNGVATLTYTAPEEPNDAFECRSGLQFQLPVEELGRMNAKFMSNVNEDARLVAETDSEEDRLARRAAAMRAERARRAATAAAAERADERMLEIAPGDIGASSAQ